MSLTPAGSESGSSVAPAHASVSGFWPAGQVQAPIAPLDAEEPAHGGIVLFVGDDRHPDHPFAEQCNCCIAAFFPWVW